MKIAPNSVVKLTYELYVNDEILEVADEADPMVFIHGLSGLPLAFEQKLVGLEDNDTFNFDVDAEDGYGEFDPDAIVDFPIENFKIEDDEVPEGLLELGNYIPFTNDEGERMTGKIIEIKPDVVILDFNHPLVGKMMHFEGKILSVRLATESELDHGHVHGEGGVNH